MCSSDLLAATGVPPQAWADETATFLGSGTFAGSLERLDSRLDGASMDEIMVAFDSNIAVEQVIPTAVASVVFGERFEDAVFAAVAAGGATDTRGALAGALAGARAVLLLRPEVLRPNVWDALNALKAAGAVTTPSAKDLAVERGLPAEPELEVGQLRTMLVVAQVGGVVWIASARVRGE